MTASSVNLKTNLADSYRLERPLSCALWNLIRVLCFEHMQESLRALQDLRGEMCRLINMKELIFRENPVIDTLGVVRTGRTKVYDLSGSL